LVTSWDATSCGEAGKLITCVSQRHASVKPDAIRAKLS
jgi:hypothetical protein